MVHSCTRFVIFSSPFSQDASPFSQDPDNNGITIRQHQRLKLGRHRIDQLCRRTPEQFISESICAPLPRHQNAQRHAAGQTCWYECNQGHHDIAQLINGWPVEHHGEAFQMLYHWTAYNRTQCQVANLLGSYQRRHFPHSRHDVRTDSFMNWVPSEYC